MRNDERRRARANAAHAAGARRFAIACLPALVAAAVAAGESWPRRTAHSGARPTGSIALFVYAGGPTRLGVGRVDNGRFRFVTERASFLAAGWAPDGRWLLTLRAVRSTAQVLELRDVSGGQPRRLRRDRASTFHRVAWSPRGNVVALTRGETGGPAIVLVDALTARRRRRVLHVEIDFLSAVAWSPDGRRLAYIRPRAATARGRFGSLRVLDLDSGRDVPSAAAAKNPSWSPDGRAIAVATPSGVATVSPSGGSRRLVTRSPLDDNPSWSPDGRWIAFDRTSRGCSTGRTICVQDVLIVARRGGRIRHVTRTRLRHESLPLWRPAR